MRIMALDPATKCGWAYAQTGGIVASGTWDLSTRRDESTGMKLLRFESKLREVAAMGVDLFVFEAARHAAPRMQGALLHQAKLQAVIERLGEELHIPYRGYSPSEIKKFATGKGNASKSDVRRAVKERFGHHTADDNESDAVALLHLARSEYGTSGPHAPAPCRRDVTDDDNAPF